MRYVIKAPEHLSDLNLESLILDFEEHKFDKVTFTKSAKLRFRALRDERKARIADGAWTIGDYNAT